MSIKFACGIVFISFWITILADHQYPNGCIGNCPPDNDPTTVYFLPNCDCNKFCQCNFGEPVLFTCPKGLHFNVELNVCDWPHHANCHSTCGSTEEEPSSSCSGPFGHFPFNLL